MITAILIGLAIILTEIILFKIDSRPLNDEEEFEVMRGLITIKMNEIFK